ncbi:Formin-binding protein 1 [Varanus komodoensis]|nr:Formin-binding protein 1 [Varanus komodoensis]
MSLLTSPHQPPPPPPSSASPSPVPNGPQSPKQQKEPLSHRFNEFMTSKPKIHCFRSLKRGGGGPEDFSNLPPEQRRKKLQQKVDELNKDIQKEVDQRDALTKMKDVYIKNPQMGDAASVDHKLAELEHNLEKLRQEARKFEGWLTEVEGRLPARPETMRRQSGMYDPQNTLTVNNCAQDRESPDGSYTEEASQESEAKVPAPEFDDEFDDEEPLPTIGTCKALYTFEGQNEGTISVTEGETLFVIEEDKGDGWTRIRRNEDEEGYVPTSYVEVFLEKNIPKSAGGWDKSLGASGHKRRNTGLVFCFGFFLPRFCFQAPLFDRGVAAQGTPAPLAQRGASLGGARSSVRRQSHIITRLLAKLSPAWHLLPQTNPPPFPLPTSSFA